MDQIKMTRKGNAKRGDEKYKAVPELQPGSCRGCAFENEPCGGALCAPVERDSRPLYKLQGPVIFVKKEPKA